MGRTADRPVPGGADLAARGADLRVRAADRRRSRCSGTARNLLTACLAALGFVWYTVVYTIWLKRRSPQNIVIGGAAGAIPPLVGWAAVTGSVAPAALYLFAIVFYWTPPHFWAL